SRAVPCDHSVPRYENRYDPRYLGWPPTATIRMVRTMSSLHIEHHNTDLAAWTSVFNGFGEIRRHAGVTAETVRRPHDDDRYVVIDLEFDTSEHAHAFLHFLRTEVWAVPPTPPHWPAPPKR